MRTGISRDIGNSFSRARSLLRDDIERPAVTIEGRLFAGQLLPAQDHDVDVLWIKLDAVAKSFSQLRGREREGEDGERSYSVKP
jgi:hypothetical protein